MSNARISGRGRYHLLDVIRGLTLISMIAYHASWDLVYIFGVDWPWYGSQAAFYWQQSICWTFILLSGFCSAFSNHTLKRGLIIWACGLLVTAVTIVFMPADRVVYGVLTLIGSAMIITALLKRFLLPHIRAVPGFLCSMYLFYLLYHVNSGYITFLPGITLSMPIGLYQGDVMTYIGFMDPSFYSTDYFPLLPWLFLYLAGYFLSRLTRQDGTLSSHVMRWNIPPLSWIGRHSLEIYLLHQPVIYMILMLLHMGGLL